MAKIPINRADRYRKIVIEQKLVTDNFPFLNARIKGLELVCRGWLRPTETSQEYRVEIKYAPWDSPDVWILSPRIGYVPGAHMYKSEKLCLYDWREQPWQDRWHLHETIVPWTAEWLLYYEIFLLTGKWVGKSAMHGGTMKIAEPPSNSDEITERTE
jgi:hypothetical protein